MNTCLMLASARGHLAVVNTLLEYAQAAGALRDLLMQGDNVFYTAPKRNTCLSLASRNGHLSVVRALLEAASRPAAQHALPELLLSANGTGANCLLYAAHQGHLQVVNMLLEAARAAGVLPSLLCREVDNNNPDDHDPNYHLPCGENCLSASVRQEHPEVTKVLLNAAREGGAKHTLLDLLFSGTWNEEYDVDNCTSLWMAAKKGDLEVVNALIQAAKAAASQIYEMRCGQNKLLGELLMYEKTCSCLWVSVKLGHLDVVKALLEAARNADVLSELLALRGHGRISCLTMAEKIGRDDIVQTLEAAGAKHKRP